MTALPDRCSDGEFERRHRRVREEMRTQGLGGLLVYGTFQGWGNLFYLTNHRDLVASYLIVPVDGDPVLFTGVWPHFEVVKRDSMIADTRFGGPRMVPMVIEELRRRGAAGGRVGLVEPDAFRLPGIPYKDMDEFRSELSGLDLVPFTRTLEDIRRRKSDEEIGLLRECARRTDRALAAVVETIKPGVTERDALRVLGNFGDPIVALISTTPMARPSLPYPGNRPTSREFRPGDVVLLEVGVGHAGYASQALRTVTLGPPTEQYERLYAVALRAYDTIRGILRDGCRAVDVVDATRFITDAGLTTGDPLVHGYGLGMEAGLHVGPKDHAAYWPPGEFSYPARASVSIEPNPCTPDMQAGVVTGDVVIVGESGCEQLHTYPRDRILVV